jgi:orotate phosphoribosyltransferase
MERNSAIKKVIDYSLKEGSIIINEEEPFTWASGFKMPIYNDNRLLLASHEIRKIITNQFLDIIKENGYCPDIIAGTATSGIPFATDLATALELPLVYVRKEKKGHGARHRVEGLTKTLTDSYSVKKAILIEDVISTGRSAMKAAEELQKANLNVITILSIFDYNFTDLYKKNSVYTLDDLISYLENISTSEKDKADILKEWRKDPFRIKAVDG